MHVGQLARMTHETCSALAGRPTSPVVRDPLTGRLMRCLLVDEKTVMASIRSSHRGLETVVREMMQDAGFDLDRENRVYHNQELRRFECWQDVDEPGGTSE